MLFSSARVGCADRSFTALSGWAAPEGSWRGDGLGVGVELARGHTSVGFVRLDRVTTSSAAPQLQSGVRAPRPWAPSVACFLAMCFSVLPRKSTGKAQASAPGREGVPALKTRQEEQPRDQVASWRST